MRVIFWESDEVQYKTHIQINDGENPLEIRLTERPFKAYMVANLAFIDGVEASAEHYELSPGAAYAAMSFYEDNRDAIEQALEEVRAIDSGDMEVDAREAIAKFKKRMNEMNKE